MTKNTRLKNFKNLFKETYPPLCAFVFKYVQDMNTCTELVQDVFVKLWEEDEPPVDYNLQEAYLYRSVKWKCISYLNSNPDKIPFGVDLEMMNTMDIEDFLCSNVDSVSKNN